MGHNKPLASLQRPGMSEDVSRWLTLCRDCGEHKPASAPHRVPLTQMAVGVPSERIAIYFIGPIPHSAGENKYVLVVEDNYTKWVEAFPIPDKEALTIADKLVTEVFCRFGCPRHKGRGV